MQAPCGRRLYAAHAHLVDKSDAWYPCWGSAWGGQRTLDVAPEDDSGVGDGQFSTHRPDRTPLRVLKLTAAPMSYERLPTHPRPTR
jgi:hypothetical protein